MIYLWGDSGAGKSHLLRALAEAAGSRGARFVRGDSFSQVDVRLSKDFRVMGNAGVEGVFDVFNLFNAKNPARYNSNGQPAAYAGTDPLQGEQRLAQLGLRVHF